MPSADHALSKLHWSPGDATQSYKYIVNPIGWGYHCEQGGRARVTCVKINEDTFQLDVTKSAVGASYFYPWNPRGVGRVMVPKNCPYGTLVLTGQMNGCALQVDAFGREGMMFRHDADGTHLNGVPGQGRCLCRVTNHDYDTPLNIGPTYLEPLIPKSRAMNLTCSYFYTLIGARLNNRRWGIYSMGTLQLGDEYTRLPHATTLMATFDEP